MFRPGLRTQHDVMSGGEFTGTTQNDGHAPSLYRLSQEPEQTGGEEAVMIFEKFHRVGDELRAEVARLSIAAVDHVVTGSLDAATPPSCSVLKKYSALGNASFSAVSFRRSVPISSFLEYPLIRQNWSLTILIRHWSLT